MSRPAPLRPSPAPDPRRRLRSSVFPALVAAASLAVSGCGAEAGSGPVYDLVVDGVTVVDPDAGVSRADRTVAVTDGRIVAVWEAGEVPRGLEAARRLEGTGRWLIPGLWDAHVHFRGGEALLEENRALLALYPLHGVTTVRDAGGDLTGHVLAWRDSIGDGDLLGPRILTSGPKLDGPDPSWAGSIPLADPAEVPAALDSVQALGADYVKLYDGSMSPEVYMAAVREAQARGLTITGHMPLGVDLLEAVEAGLDGTEHLYYVLKGTATNREDVSAGVRAGELGFWEAMYGVAGRPDPARRARVFRAMREGGAAVTPTLHIGDVLSRVEQVDHGDDPELAWIPGGIVDTYARRVEGARRASPESREANRALRAEMAGLVRPLHEAGVTLLAGSDAGPFNSFVYPGSSLHAELEALVEAGLSPLEALRSATTAPADYMGRGDELGRIAPGYRADLVLLDADPFADISATRAIAAVILRGEDVLTREEIGAALEAREVR